jgi:formate dehydrogenase subunit delta
MDAPKLTMMANQIARFFEARGEAAALAGTEDHLRKFWDPRMRAQIVAHLKSGGEGLSPGARAAVARLDPDAN